MTDSTAADESAGPAVDGVVLAAGASRRMGEAKALLGVDDRTFVARAVEALSGGGCRNVVVVVRPDKSAVAEAADAAGGRVVLNTDSNSQQIDSLRLGLRNLNPGAGAAVVLPVDHPLVEPATVEALIAAYRARHAPIVRAAYQGEAGHPVLFSVDVFGQLYDAPLPEGARSVIDAFAEELEDVAVDDRGVVADIDTPEDYRRHVGESGSGAGG